jgi:hypothetical protein
VGCSPSGDQPETAAPAGSGTLAESSLADRLEEVRLPASYELRSIPPDGEAALTMLFKLEDGRAAKVKMIKVDGWLVLDAAANETFAFEEEWGHVMKLPLSAVVEGVWADPRDYVDPDAKIVGEESVDGELCWIAAAVSESGASRVWVGASDGLPRQVETAAGITRFVYSRIDQIEDHEFELPPNVRVVDLEELVPG